MRLLLIAHWPECHQYGHHQLEGPGKEAWSWHAAALRETGVLLLRRKERLDFMVGAFKSSPLCHSLARGFSDSSIPQGFSVFTLRISRASGNTLSCPLVGYFCFSCN